MGGIIENATEGEIMLSEKSFDDDRTGTGTAEWAEYKVNIQKGCSNDCLYCYAAEMACGRFGWRTRDKWHIEELSGSVDRQRWMKVDGVVMFPSSHDITPKNIDAYIRIALLILAAGNRLLIVTKPRLACIDRLCRELDDFRDQVLFRFTIGTMDDEVSKAWEPGASLPIERLSALSFAFVEGFKTSVSIEPMLGGAFGAAKVVDMVKTFVTDTIWVGKMNKPRQRVDMSKPKNVMMVEYLESVQNDVSILQLYHWLKHEEKIRWKDSIREVLTRYGYLKGGVK